MTGVTKLIAEKSSRKAIVFTNYPELFYNHPSVLLRVNLSKLPQIFTTILKAYLKASNEKNLYLFRFADKCETLEEFMARQGSPRNLILSEVHAKNLKIDINFKRYRNYIRLSNEECESYEKKFSNLHSPYAIVALSGKTSYTPNKYFPPQKLEETIKLISNKFQNLTLIHVGTKEDPCINGVIDFRGKTKGVRELAWIVKNAAFIISTEGLLNHLSSCFQTPSFVIFSGFHHKDIANYQNTVPITTSQELSCSPCWLTTPCPIPGKPCTSTITPREIFEVIEKNT